MNQEIKVSFIKFSGSTIFRSVTTVFPIITAMFFTSIAVLLTNSANSFASAKSAVDPLASKYYLTKEPVPYRGWTEETIRDVHGKGQKRFLELKEIGWQCRINQYLGFCRLYEFIRPDDQEFQFTLRSLSHLSTLQIAPQTRDPELIHESKLFKLYKVFRNFQIENNQWEDFEIFDSPSIKKIHLRDREGKLEYSWYLNANDDLEQQIILNRRLKANLEQTIIFGVVWKATFDRTLGL